MKKIFLLFALLISTTLFSAPISFLTLSDIHYGENNLPGDGNDTGNEAWLAALTKFGELSTRADFVLLLGDIPTHLFGEAPEKGAYEAKIFEDLFNADKKNIPLFYIPGNNDSLLGNYQPFSNNHHSPLDFAKHWQGACSHCEELMIDDSHMYKEGYYISYAIPDNKDIILIALNTTQFTITPPFLPSYPNQDEDAANQLTWFKEQLKSHHAKQLIIAMHEPPGIDFRGHNIWHLNFLSQFADALSQYQQHYQEINLFSAHTHYDEIRKLPLTNTQSTFIFGTPSISRDHHNNMAMKRYELNDDLKLQDFTTYFSHALTSWGNEHYHGIKYQGIFSTCKDKTLIECLNLLSPEAACQAISDGLMLGAKSTNINDLNCLRSYAINMDRTTISLFHK